MDVAQHTGIELTSFVGRRGELARVREQMAGARLVTLVGPGGVGKTRLAVRAAEQARRAFEDGVCFVDLASVDDATRLPGTILRALGVRDQSPRDARDVLLAQLADRQVLLVLDNCEHLLDGVAALAVALLEHAGRLRLLATSREAIGVTGERLVVVPPLAVPDPGLSDDLAALARCDSVALLVDRARLVRPDFEVTAATAAAVIALCAALDGIPLAIELAASRLRVLTVQQVADRLDDRFGLLSNGPRAVAPRQQTLRSLIDWSHELCTPGEQVLWSRLSVFAGSFDLDAAEAVCGGGEGPVLDALDHLVAKSIVSVDRQPDRVRFRLLGIMREYGGERLDAGDADLLRRAHRDFYLARAEAICARWCGPGQAAALELMRADYPNLEAALAWSFATPANAAGGAALVAALRYLWIAGGYLGSGRRWLDRALDTVVDPSPQRGEALWVAAWVCLMQGDSAIAERRLQECARLGDALGSGVLSAQALGWSGLVALFDGRRAPAAAAYRTAIERLRAAGELSAAMTLSFQRAVALAYGGAVDDAGVEARWLLETAAEHGERWHRAYGHWALAMSWWCARDLDAAAGAVRDALELELEFADAMATPLMIELSAWIAGARGRHERAVQLLGAARAVWRATGTSIEAFGPDMAADSHRTEAAARRQLGERAFEALLVEHSGRGVYDAIGVALDGRGAHADEPPPASPLSRREREVAALIAEGLRNRDIAETLVISPRTVETHVERILGKLGFRSRSQVAAWAAAHPAQAS